MARDEVAVGRAEMAVRADRLRLVHQCPSQPSCLELDGLAVTELDDAQPLILRSAHTYDVATTAWTRILRGI
jgi:hypothetical protein